MLPPTGIAPRTRLRVAACYCHRAAYFGSPMPSRAPPRLGDLDHGVAVDLLTGLAHHVD